MEKIIALLWSPLFWKGLVTVLGATFSLVNLGVDPSDLVTLPDDASSYDYSSIKAAGFAIITAMALFAGSVPTGDGQSDKMVDAATRMLGILATFGAGWFWLHGATYGSPGKYLYGVIILTGAAGMAVLIWGGFYVLVAFIANGVAFVARVPLSNVFRFVRFLFHWFRRKRWTGS